MDASVKGRPALRDAGSPFGRFHSGASPRASGSGSSDRTRWGIDCWWLCSVTVTCSWRGRRGLRRPAPIKELAAHIDASFHRVQFTPDLLPADLTGTDVYRPQDGSFVFQRGPIFHNVVLADEVNRAPAKVQSALLEAMGERQVTVGRTTYALPRLYLVMATQNPIEQEGTYRLPEAQLDRFLLYVRIASSGRGGGAANPGAVARAGGSASPGRTPRTPMRWWESPRSSLREGKSSSSISRPRSSATSSSSCLATRGARDYGEDLRRWIGFGASPRASIALDRAFARVRLAPRPELRLARGHPVHRARRTQASPRAVLRGGGGGRRLRAGGRRAGGESPRALMGHPAAGTRAPRPMGATLELDALLRLRAHAHLFDLRGGRWAPDPLSGARPSRYRARGMEYAESRAYLPGDEDPETWTGG